MVRGGWKKENEKAYIPGGFSALLAAALSIDSFIALYRSRHYNSKSHKVKLYSQQLQAFFTFGTNLK